VILCREKKEGGGLDDLDRTDASKARREQNDEIERKLGT
jgi:hypothetical protein